MIELDKRIIEGKRPLTAFDVMKSKFIGTDCYFSDNASDYGDLSNCQLGCLLSANGMTGVFNAKKNNSYANFNYCLPCEWVNEEKSEPKYRPFTGIEFAEKFNLKLNSIIHLRGVPTDDHCYNYKVVFTGYRWCDDVFQVFLNGSWLDLPKLLELYEYEENGEWHKFGILEE